MNDLEFRRRLFADPHDTDVAKEAAKDPEQQALLEDLQAFDAQLNDALQVEVPEGLAERILAKQQQDNDHNVLQRKSWFRRNKTPLATAASATFAVGLYFMSATQSPLLAGDHALSHVRHEKSAFASDKEIAMQNVNEKLAKFGAKLRDLPGKVTYATFCHFQGQESLHLVFQSEFGPMTVFIVPIDKKNSLGGNGQFEDEQYSGIIDQDKHGATVLVANLGSPVKQYQKQVVNALKWL
jgi:hypothetical protein